MYNAADSHDNMQKSIMPFLKHHKRYVTFRVLLKGSQGKVFLNKDFKNLDNSLKHQGSAACYPNMKQEI